jgi:hypothetical protein
MRLLAIAGDALRSLRYLTSLFAVSDLGSQLQNHADYQSYI